MESYRSWIESIQDQKSQESESKKRLAEDMTALSLAYSRGFSDGFLGGSDHQSLVEGRFPKHRGVFLGYVVEAVSPPIIPLVIRFPPPITGAISR